MKVNKLNESNRTDDYISIKEINWLKDNPGQEIKKAHYKVSYNDYVDANTNEPMGGHFTVIENQGRDTTRVDDVKELKDYIVRRYNKYFEESISRSEPTLHFQGKSSHTFTTDKKWEVDFDEAGNILARTRHGKPYYFKGHINDKVNNFPYTDEDNIILAAREQHELKFGGKSVDEDLDWKDYKITYIRDNGKEDSTTFSTYQSDVEYAWRKSNQNVPHTKIKSIKPIKESTNFSISSFSKGKSINEASEGFQKEFYNDYVILKNRAGDGWDIYSYDGTPEKITKTYLEDEGYASLKDAKAEIDKWISSSRMDESKSIKAFGAKAKKLNEWAPNMGECPACGDTSFDTKKGKCTKCSYRESLNEDTIDNKYLTILKSVAGPAANIVSTTGEDGEAVASATIILKDENKFNAMLNRFNSFSYNGLTAKAQDVTKMNNLDNEFGAYVELFKSTSNESLSESSDYKMVEDFASVTSLADECGENTPKVSHRDIRFRFANEDDETKFINKLYELNIPYTQAAYGVIVSKSSALDESTSLIDKKFNTLGKAGKPMYLTNDQLTDMQAKFKDYDFEETQIDKSLPNGQKAYVAKKKQVNEASYGGAFDIEDDQYFTRDEINELAYEVCEHLNEIFPTFFDVSDVFIENGVLDLTVQDEDGMEYNSTKRIDMRKIKKPSDLNRAYVLEFVYDIRKQVEEYHGSYANESLTEDVDTVPIVGPKEGPEFGLSELINTAIQNELETVSEYNTLALNARSEGFEDIAKVIEEINTEENRHIGQLQELLKIVSPNATAIEDGKLEGEEQLSNSVPQEV